MLGVRQLLEERMMRSYTFVIKEDSFAFMKSWRFYA
jgi:hypothetical protein